MAKNKINLEDFLKTAKFSDDVFADIFRELVTKYKKETPRQALIRAIITIFERRYPSEIRYHQKTVQEAKEKQANEFAAEKKQDQRMLFRFPTSLWNRLTMLVKDPEFLSQSDPIKKEEKEEIEWVVKNFPQYLIPTKY